MSPDSAILRWTFSGNSKNARLALPQRYLRSSALNSSFYAVMPVPTALDRQCLQSIHFQ